MHTQREKGTTTGCGIFGVINYENQHVFPYVYWGLRAQNHRGHQSHGFLTYSNGEFYAYKSLDLVPKVKSDAIHEWFSRLPGSIGIANVRYTTSGKCDEVSIVQGTQPFIAAIDGLKVALSFNGNIVNTQPLRKEMAENFSNFIYNCDSDLVCHKMLLGLKQTNDLVLAAKGVMESLDGAFSVTGITGDGTFFAFKDPHGIKPLCAGHDPNSKTYAFSSETVSLDMNSFVRDFELNPGELVIVSKDGFKRIQVIPNPRHAFCAFEYAYFARPDSIFNHKYVYEIREDFGRNIVKEYPQIAKDGDIIISVPETGDDSAMGVHEASGLRWERASRRHRYVTERAFILLNAERYSTIDKKINILDAKVKDKNVIITEDSIVRGDTNSIIIEKMRKAGAKKVYVFVTFPRIIGPCFYGIDMSSYGQLIGSRHSSEEIAKIIGADGVCYQSLEGLIKAIGTKEDELCLACVTGKYPTPCAQKIADIMKNRFQEGCEEKGRIYENDDVQP
ncbi:amidophosphoribosyltransferase [Candidatus Bathycorpusculum sp.]|uniref:amidophosphoribosyltransferase n=1 Tax=Candidatus Bathycorpusculum sp. TaxID=2994959 RepID=UPI002824F0ED|nr:amidophosphoribosyltransferase [Candidatus Termitimicrobium sp.]